MWLPSVYCVVMVDIVGGIPDRGPSQASRHIVPLRGHGLEAVRRGAPFRHAVSGNGGRRY